MSTKYSCKLKILKIPRGTLLKYSKSLKSQNEAGTEAGTKAGTEAGTKAGE